MDYKQIFKNTITEFIDDLNQMVRNDAVSQIQTGWNLFGETFMPQILSTIKQMSNEESFIKEDDAFFDLPLDFFVMLELKQWYPNLDKNEKKIIWKYLKTMNFLVNKFI